MLHPMTIKSATSGAFDHVTTFDPTRPREAVAIVPIPSADDVRAAVALARDAGRAWDAAGTARATALGALAAGLESRAEELADLMVREVGKPVIEARAEVARAVGVLRYYAQVVLDPVAEEFAGADGVRTIVRREPLGVVLAVCPWNFPLAIPVWKAAPALAYGNAVLLKPAPQAVGTAALLGEIATEVLPPGVLTILPLPASRTAELLDDPLIDGATFTGSTGAGLQVVQRMAARGAPVQAEMGGHNPAIVCEDADIARAARLVVSGAMGYAGQKCTATRRLITVGEVHRPLLRAIADAVRDLRIGDPRDPVTTVGPVIDGPSAERFAAAVQGALDAGGELVAEAPAPPGEGHFVAPAVIALDDPLAAANQEETFGPLLTVLRTASEDEAVEVANATRFGLAGAVHARDVPRATGLALRLRVGMPRVNVATTGVEYFAPFGGSLLSGFGPREQGRAAREHFTTTRTLSVAPVD